MSSTVTFPSSNDDQLPPSTPTSPRAPHLPFRRISLPAVPSAAIYAAAYQYQPQRPTVFGDEENGPVLKVGPSQISSMNLQIPTSSSPTRRKARPSSLAVPLPRSIPDSGMQERRKKVVREILDTERTYVDGLDLIYNHFLAPILESLNGPNPLLSRRAITTIFSNFIDIWNLHSAFYKTLYAHLAPSFAGDSPDSPLRRHLMTNLPTSPSHVALVNAVPRFMEAPPPIASILSQHFPYLSLYSPFVTSYPTVLASLHNLTSHTSTSYSPVFADWLRAREQDPRCGRLGLRDWLLTLVQRCPRYLLLLKDLLACTEKESEEYSQLLDVERLVDRVNNALDAALLTQTLTIQLLAVQRATPNLTFSLIEPGRTLIRRGPLRQYGDRIDRVREFFLFSDCLLWLSKGGEREAGTGQTDARFWDDIVENQTSPGPGKGVIRSGSEVDVPAFRRSASRPASRLGAPTNEEDKWWYRGKIDLMNLEVSALHDDFKFAAQSPEKSFTLKALSGEDRDEWVDAIRAAKVSRMVALDVVNVKTTLTSSTSTQHLRRALQALPYQDDESPLTSPKGKKRLNAANADFERERRGRVDHFVPAVWVPDAKAKKCMRCGGVFNWRRRRHHCRLCGQCVCANCSAKTFFIRDPNVDNDTAKPARACNECYDSVFPLIDSESPDFGPLDGRLPHYSSIGTLTALPASKSMPSLALPQVTTPVIAHPLEYSFPVPVEGDRPKSGILLPFSRPLSSSSGGHSRPTSIARLSSYTTNSDVFTTSETLVNSTANIGMGTADSAITVVGLPGHQDAGDIAADIVSPPTPNGSFMSPRLRQTTFAPAAVALHTASVTTRPSIDGEGKSRRFSLVLGTRSKFLDHDGTSNTTKSKEKKKGASESIASHSHSRMSFDRGAAIGKLSDLLGRK